MSDQQMLWTTSEAAKQLRVSPSVIHRLRADGELPYVRIGRKVFFKPSTIIEYVDNQQRVDAQEK